MNAILIMTAATYVGFLALHVGCVTLFHKQGRFKPRTRRRQ